MTWRSRRDLRQSPDRDGEESTQSGTAVMGPTSSGVVTFTGRLRARAAAAQSFSSGVVDDELRPGDEIRPFRASQLATTARTST